MRKSKPTFVDLFSGAGGLLTGFIEAGYKPLFSVENWEPCIRTHARNYPDVTLLDRDITKITDKEIRRLIADTPVDALVGGPPCQGFSSIGRRLTKDPRNRLVFEFIRFLRVIKPKIFLMENVRGLLSAKMETGNITSLLKDEFKRAGYPHVVSQVLCAADYGVPQLRYRVFYMGVRRDISIAPSFPLPTHTRINYATVDAAIMDLVGKEETVPNHVPMQHNAIVSARMRYIPEGAGLPSNGLPKHLSYGSRSDYAHRKLRNFSHVYKRLHRQKPATTMVPGHNAFPLHPTEDRSLTVREAARIQTFDDRIVFAGTRQEQCIQVGNAVPVRLARHLASHIRCLLQLMVSSNE